ncbi:serine hydrolase domain-containing protein [Flagellimonas beolgyonensis]|uniref:serine hydrolase domain-containing protein n=1 Tax=Flagellimonas beolgyonensis TaxID=864064 RepID=UPI003D65BCE9
MRDCLHFLTAIFIAANSYGQQHLDTGIKQLFDAQLEKSEVKNAFLRVYSKSKGINIQFADSDDHTGVPISMDNPIYLASITKMLTATAIGILKEDKKLDFEGRIYQHLPEPLMANLHVFGGTDYSNAITIAHLLQHTSGLPDYFTGTTVDGSPNIINQLLVDTDKSWSPQEMIAFGKEKMEPHFVPGQGYHYTDTEYVLLALIIENVSGTTLDQFFQQFIFEPLGMDASFINLKSAPIKKQLPMAQFYAGDIALSSIQSLSADWGGGGLVSTTQDLVQFLVAFQENKIVKKETRLAMQHWVHETKGMEYGFGIRKVSFNTLFDTDTHLEVIGHTGSTASFLWYCPQLDTYIAGTLNQLEASKSTLNWVYDILTLIDQH